jgi:hypothetical protein
MIRLPTAWPGQDAPGRNVGETNGLQAEKVSRGRSAYALGMAEIRAKRAD